MLSNMLQFCIGGSLSPALLAGSSAGRMNNVLFDHCSWFLSCGSEPGRSTPVYFNLKYLLLLQQVGAIGHWAGHWPSRCSLPPLIWSGQGWNKILHYTSIEFRQNICFYNNSSDCKSLKQPPYMKPIYNQHFGPKSRITLGHMIMQWHAECRSYVVL